LKPNFVSTWRELAEKFVVKCFHAVLNARKRNDISYFKKTNEENLFEACDMFKELFRRCPRHGIPMCIQMETFYNGLVPLTRLMIYALYGVNC